MPDKLTSRREFREQTLDILAKGYKGAARHPDAGMCFAKGVESRCNLITTIYYDRGDTPTEAAERMLESIAAESA